MILVDDIEMEWEEGMTIACLLDRLENTEFCAVVRMDGRLVSSPSFADTLIPDDATLRLLPLVAGG